ncbi:hypothetical protein HGRIS_012492 [Hohenbuehelia grisea]|uniref:Uncharacterized protein n=1 Tax=Hohenbuehelia grisea TaxID=104357 RepID=A0ABR3ISG3_9AGAR
MVLNARNFSKRISSNAENTPPAKAARAQTSFQTAARRRRARTAGTATRTPHVAVTQAKRRDNAKHKQSVIRFQMATPPHTPAIEMLELGTGHASGTSPNTPITLPRLLQRQVVKRFPREPVTDAEIRFIVAEGTNMFRSAHLAKIQPTASNAVPKEVPLLVKDIPTHLRPTHALAVYSSQPSGGRTKVTLYPTHKQIHNICCHILPPLPGAVKDAEKDIITVPVVTLALPSPQTFPLLSAYLYTKQQRALFASFLPPGCRVPDNLQPDADINDDDIEPFGNVIAQTYTAQAILQCVLKVNGVWRNACALGVTDQRLWDTVDLVWEVLLSALAISTGLPKDQWPERMCTVHSSDEELDEEDFPLLSGSE